jgi:hypothetical protein
LALKYLNPKPNPENQVNYISMKTVEGYVRELKSRFKNSGLLVMREGFNFVGKVNN